MKRILIKGAHVVTCDPALGEVVGGDVLVEGERIAAVGRNLAAAEAEVVDASGMIAIPGLINAHIHTWQTGLKGMGSDWALGDYQRYVHHGSATFVSATDNYYANLIGALAQIDGGVTTIFDWCHNLRDPEMTDASIDGLEESGIRAVFGHATPKPPERPGQRPYWETPHSEEEVRRLRTGRLASDDRLVTLALAILGPDLSTYEVSRHDFKLAREYGLMSSAHTHGRTGRRVTPDGMWRLREEGLLGPDHNIVHGNALPDDELKMLVDAGCTFSATPVSEMLGGYSPAVSWRVETLGGVVSIGSDTSPQFSGGMLHTIRFGFQHQRELDNRVLWDKGQWPATRHRTTVRMALGWATTRAARSLMMADRIGSLTPGKQADVTLIRTDSLSLFPSLTEYGDPVGIIVMSAEPALVDSVMIAGRFAKRAGALIYPRERLEAAKQGLRESRRRTLVRLGFRQNA